MLRIHRATEADAPVIVTMIKALAEYERLADHVVATEERIRETLFGPHAVAAALVARMAEQPVGFAVWFHNYSTFLGRPGLYLEDVFVVPEHRGRGVGKALLSEVARVAVERGCGRMEWSVLDWNEPAIQFYKRLGAQPMTDWTIFRLTGEALEKLAGRKLQT